MSQGNHPSIVGEADAPADERMAAVLDGVFDPFLLLEAVRNDHGDLIDLRVTAANPPACAGLGVDPGTIVDALLLPLLNEDERTTLLPLYHRVIETGEPLVLDGVVMRYSGPDGGARRFDVRALRIGDGLSVSWRDVTPRWEEREALTAARWAQWTSPRPRMRRRPRNRRVMACRVMSSGDADGYGPATGPVDGCSAASGR